MNAAAADPGQWGRVINETIVNKRKIIYINGGIYNGRAYLTFTWRGKLVFVFAFVRGVCLLPFTPSTLSPLLRPTFRWPSTTATLPRSSGSYNRWSLLMFSGVIVRVVFFQNIITKEHIIANYYSQPKLNSYTFWWNIHSIITGENYCFIIHLFP